MDIEVLFILVQTKLVNYYDLFEESLDHDNTVKSNQFLVYFSPLSFVNGIGSRETLIVDTNCI
jgi:hypothetical protein